MMLALPEGPAGEPEPDGEPENLDEYNDRVEYGGYWCSRMAKGGKRHELCQVLGCGCKCHREPGGVRA